MLLKLIFDVMLKQKKEVVVPKEKSDDSKLVSVSFQTLLSFVNDAAERESITIESISNAALLEEFQRKNSIPSFELRIKALYLYFISNFVELIYNNMSLFFPSTMQLQDKDCIIDGFFIRLWANYVPESFTDLREGRINSLVKYNAGDLKNIFNTMVMNYWNSCLVKYNRDLGHANPLVYSKMLSLFEQCLALEHLENYMFNLLAPSLMPLYYRFKDANIPLNILVKELDAKLTTMAKNKEPTSEICEPKPSISNLITEILIFDFPRKESIFDELRQVWLEKQKKSYSDFFGAHMSSEAPPAVGRDPSTFNVANIFGSA